MILLVFWAYSKEGNWWSEAMTVVKTSLHYGGEISKPTSIGKKVQQTKKTQQPKIFTLTNSNKNSTN